MRHRLAAALFGIALLIPVSTSMAQQGDSGCTAGQAALPPELAGWSSRGSIVAGDDPAAGMAATLTPGVAVEASLRSTSEVRYVVRPEKPGGSVSYGGLFAFTIAEAGLYRVALGSGAWIDVLKDRTALESAAHGHGPQCSGIRKMVDFRLKPGRYTLQVAANGAPVVSLMIARLP